MKHFLFASIIVLSVSGTAHATILPSLLSTDPNGSNLDFNYAATLSGDERLDPAATSGATCPGSSSPCNPPGTFFTLYDIVGFVAVTKMPMDWTASTQLTGISPSSIAAGFDDPSLFNVTFTYTGPVVQGNGSQVPFLGFQIESIYGGIKSMGAFTSQATKDVGDSSGNTDQVVGPVSVPAGGAVPEPATLLLTGLGLIGLSILGPCALKRR